jgi:membrane associated rhomboid family serine protease
MSITITTLLVILTAIISYRGFQNPEFLQQLKHWPYREKHQGEWYRFVSSGFLHGSWLHLLINMFVFWQFGLIVESAYESCFGPTMGKVWYVVLYLTTIIVADISTYVKHKDHYQFSSIGASGAVSGILFIYILLMPWNTLYLWAIIPIPAILVGVGYLIYSHQAAKSSGSRIDHDAHFYGAVFGVVFTLILKPDLLFHFIEKIQNTPW